MSTATFGTKKTLWDERFSCDGYFRLETETVPVANKVVMTM